MVCGMTSTDRQATPLHLGITEVSTHSELNQKNVSSKTDGYYSIHKKQGKMGLDDQ